MAASEKNRVFRPERHYAQFLWLGAAVLAVAVGLMFVSFRSFKYQLPLPSTSSTTLSQSLVVDRVEKVAKLVASETTLRDVVIYENTWYGSTKRSLVVVTGKVLAGIDLQNGTSVEIDEPNKRIAVTLPRPTVLGIEITDLKTYDEQRGLWNTFAPSDRDSIFQLAREQFGKSSQELKVTQTAEQSARELLASMFSANGYSVDVTYS
ncbi:MAG TPA: DUF4230 domain-containing protein [Blastocatellia bacterium]|nr:DUF4230 domain-containing protein [Blastocatellia bacterium]